MIELLSVIVILAIIALIAVPVVMNIITKSQKSAFKDSAYRIVKAGELYYTNQLLEPDGMTEGITFNLSEENEGLEIKGEVPEGEMRINKEGEIALAISNGKYCVTKYYTDEDINIKENIDKCTIPYILKSLVTTSDDLEIMEINECVIDKKCESGTAFAIKVNASETYKFYVINDTGSEVTLIMDRNLGKRVRWYTQSDNSYGPLTVLNQLQTSTSEWLYIPEREYIISDDGGGNMYSPFKVIMRARIPKYKELNDLKTENNNKMPTYLCENLVDSNPNELADGYWTTAASSTNDDYANYVHYRGIFASYYTSMSGAGARPVITLSK